MSGWESDAGAEGNEKWKGVSPISGLVKLRGSNMLFKYTL